MSPRLTSSSTVKPSDPNWQFRTVNHEVAHAVLAVGLGFQVNGMSVIPGESAVHVEPDRGDRLPLMLMVVLAGQLGEDPSEPMRWKPNERSEDQDERQAAAICRVCKIDEDGWNEATAIVKDYLAEPDVRRASRELSYELRADRPAHRRADLSSDARAPMGRGRLTAARRVSNGRRAAVRYRAARSDSLIAPPFSEMTEPAGQRSRAAGMPSSPARRPLALVAPGSGWAVRSGQQR